MAIPCPVSASCDSPARLVLFPAVQARLDYACAGAMRDPRFGLFASFEVVYRPDCNRKGPWTSVWQLTSGSFTEVGHTCPASSMYIVRGSCERDPTYVQMPSLGGFARDWLTKFMVQERSLAVRGSGVCMHFSTAADSCTEAESV